jgi:SMC interacting uncharacterized protein involved in chromosome segregation
MQQLSKLQKLQKAMGVKASVGPKEIANKFIKQEEDSFNRFRDLSSLKQKVGQLEIELFEMQAQLTKQKEEEEDQRRQPTTNGKPKVSFCKLISVQVFELRD